MVCRIAKDVFRQWREYDRALCALGKVAKEAKRDADPMPDRLEKAIAATTICTQLEVHLAYERLDSWDDVISAANETLRTGIPMGACVDDILETRDRLEAHLVCEKMRCAGLQGYAAGRRVGLESISPCCLRRTNEPHPRDA